MTIVIEPVGQRESGPCACCGGTSRTVWASVHADNECVAVYYIHWTLGELARHGAIFDLIVGAWGETAVPSDRQAVSLAYRIFDTGPSVMVIDAGARPVAQSPLAGRSLARADVIGTPLAATVFGIVDAALLQDRRLSEFWPA